MWCRLPEDENWRHSTKNKKKTIEMEIRLKEMVDGKRVLLVLVAERKARERRMRHNPRSLLTPPTG